MFLRVSAHLNCMKVSELINFRNGDGGEIGGEFKTPRAVVIPISLAGENSPFSAASRIYCRFREPGRGEGGIKKKKIKGKCINGVS